MSDVLGCRRVGRVGVVVGVGVVECGLYTTRCTDGRACEWLIRRRRPTDSSTRQKLWFTSVSSMQCTCYLGKGVRTTHRIALTVLCEAIRWQFAAAETNQAAQRDLLRCGWSQPRRTGTGDLTKRSLLLSSDEIKSAEMR